MKKVIAIISILFLLMGCTSVYATSQVNEVAQSTTGKIIEIKDKELKTLEEYKEAYGSDAYGLTAFLLNKIRVKFEHIVQISNSYNRYHHLSA